MGRPYKGLTRPLDHNEGLSMCWIHGENIQRGGSGLLTSERCVIYYTGWMKPIHSSILTLTPHLPSFPINCHGQTNRSQVVEKQRSYTCDFYSMLFPLPSEKTWCLYTRLLVSKRDTARVGFWLFGYPAQWPKQRKNNCMSITDPTRSCSWWDDGQITSELFCFWFLLSSLKMFWKCFLLIEGTRNHFSKGNCTDFTTEGYSHWCVFFRLFRKLSTTK